MTASYTILLIIHPNDLFNNVDVLLPMGLGELSTADFQVKMAIEGVHLLRPYLHQHIHHPVQVPVVVWGISSVSPVMLALK